jgi:hypothetical protein
MHPRPTVVMNFLANRLLRNSSMTNGRSMWTIFLLRPLSLGSETPPLLCFLSWASRLDFVARAKASTSLEAWDFPLSINLKILKRSLQGANCVACSGGHAYETMATNQVPFDLKRINPRWGWMALGHRFWRFVAVLVWYHVSLRG